MALVAIMEVLMTVAAEGTVETERADRAAMPDRRLRGTSKDSAPFALARR